MCGGAGSAVILHEPALQLLALLVSTPKGLHFPCEGGEHGAMGLLILSCCLSSNTIVVRCAGS